MTVKGQPPNRAALKKHLKSLECVPALPHFVPKKRGRKSRTGKATTEGLCRRYIYIHTHVYIYTQDLVHTYLSENMSYMYTQLRRNYDRQRSSSAPSD